MRLAGVVLCGWVAVAPALSACACPPTPDRRMGCEGTSRCCCPPAKHDSCPRSVPFVDTLDQPAAGIDLAADVTVLFTADHPVVVVAPLAAREADEAPIRGSPTRPRHLLHSVLLI